jgi:DNA modification methylase
MAHLADATSDSDSSPVAKDLHKLLEPVDGLSLLPGNPRIGNVDAVAASLARFGQLKPIVARADGTVVAGNHTLQAARQLGWDRIAVVRIDVDEATAKAFALADNRTAELGGYDDVALAALIAEVADADEALLADTGWDTVSVAELLASLEPEAILPEPIGDPDDVPDAPPPTTVPGDLWLLGDHRVLCGDATSVDDLDRLLDGDRPDMVWTDPPYGVDYVGKTADALTIRNDGSKGLGELLSAAFAALVAVCAPGAAVYVAAPAGKQSLEFATALDTAGLFRQRLVWVKDSLVLGHSDYHYRHEDIYFGYTPGQGRRGRGAAGWYGDNAQTSVLEYPRPQRNREHPTMKPVALVQHCIRNSAPGAGVVLDTFGGSGTTLVAAHLTGRTARLLELDPGYVDVICRRYQHVTGDKPVLAATGEPHDFDS